MGVRKYTQEVIKEGKRVRWPKKDVFMPALITTIVICVFCALVLSIEDLASGSLIGELKEIFGGGSVKEAADGAIRMIG